MSGFAKFFSEGIMNLDHRRDSRPLQMVRPDFPLLQRSERETRMFMGRGNTDAQIQDDAYLEPVELDKLKKNLGEFDLRSEYLRMIDLGLIRG